jgi:MerR family mercuric resistance operon transcriptional regulator
MITTRGLTIGRLAERAGVNLETVRYYERIGLMPKPDRTLGGHRSYTAEQGRRLTFIRRARELGFGLDHIRALISLAEPGEVSCVEVQAMAAAHLDGIRAKIADLLQLETVLAETVSRCTGDQSPTCPVIDVLAG